jgi:Ca2+-binding EF-hand superfamily protein
VAVSRCACVSGDSDASGTLDKLEIQTILEWFRDHVPGDDMVFTSIWEMADVASSTAEAGSTEESTDLEPSSAAAPATAMDEALHRVDRQTFTMWARTLTGSLHCLDEYSLHSIDGSESGGAPTSLDLRGFKRWLRAVAGHLPAKVFERAMAQLGEAVNKQIEARRLFHSWDKDGSGALDLAEVKEVINWFRANAAELSFEKMWDALPTASKVDLAAFEAWLLIITQAMQADAFAALAKKLQEHLRTTGLGVGVHMEGPLVV